MRNNNDRLRMLFVCLCTFLGASLMRDGCFPPPPLYSPEQAAIPLPEMMHRRGYHRALDDYPPRMILRAPKGNP